MDFSNNATPSSFGPRGSSPLPPGGGQPGRNKRGGRRFDRKKQPGGQPHDPDMASIIAKAVKNHTLKEGLAKEETPKPTTRPAGPGKKRSRGKPGGGGAFTRAPRMNTYKHKPYLKTGKDADTLAPGERLKVIVIGGNEEVGRNCTVLEYGNDIIIIDMGLQFPDEDMPGVDYIIPNLSCLKGKEKNIRGVIITHAHYDHIGGIPHLMHRLGNPPLFSTDLTCGIIKRRQEDHRDKPPLNIHTVKSSDVLQLGAFKVEFFGVAHSMAASMGVIVNTPCGIIVHTGDFKLETGPQAQSLQETEKIKALGKRGVLALMIDSTNASQPGRQIAEHEIQHNIDEIIASAKGRIIIGTFASMISRIQQIIAACERQGRKVAVEGFSMRSNILIAQELGYMKVQKGTIIDSREAMKLPREKVAIVCTGAQGEERAVLMRIANREHPFIEIEPGDTVVFSSSVIPGNERSVQRVKDTLCREGAEVIHYKMMDVHAGGHAKQEDLVEMQQMVRPKYLIPIEGHYSFLVDHAKAAVASGFNPNNIFIADNGQIIEFDKHGNGNLTNKKVLSEYVFVDGLGVGDTNHIVLRDRQELAGDGIVIVVAVVAQRTGKLLHMPDLISRGFVYMKEHQELIQAARKKAADILKDEDPRSSANAPYLKDKLKDDLGEFLFHKTQRRPMIMPIIVEV
ncbi:ribonuclease J [Candidatus Uhrbacteria bacterium]|nr:ribonuclease J [Candidatus Uhrbacteria bacterium]